MPRETVNTDHSKWDYKLTAQQQELLEKCARIKAGDTKLQRLLESRGLRQYTQEEINVVNTLRRKPLTDFPEVDIEPGQWMHVPKHQYDHYLLWPATILDVRHLGKWYYLANLQLDNTFRLEQWVITTKDEEEGLRALFDASPYIKEEEDGR